MRRFVILVSVTLFIAGLEAQPGAPLLLQQPTMNRTSIVFVFAGDLWSVPRAGGAAIRLTSGPGLERNPLFSPDGTQLAFTGEYDGNVDVFVLPAAGGVPRRLTWHPSADNVSSWTPDGKNILFSTARTAFSRFEELYTVPVGGGAEQKLPLPMGFEASYSADGTRLAYMPLPRAFQSWKRYRGGEAAVIWIASLASSRIEKVPHTTANDFNPMWIGDRIYFLSDRNGPVTLFSYDLASKRVAQAIANNGLDLKSASAGPDGIVYEQFGGIHVFDPKSGSSRAVTVSVAGDMPEVREHFVNVGQRLASPRVSPTGMRALFEARGEILTVPAEKGDVRNLTNTTSVMERSPSWSPDGKTISYFSEESGEYMLHLRAQDATGPVTKISLGPSPGFYGSPRWSPDSKKLAYTDAHLGLWYIDLESKKPVKVDTARYGSDMTAAWSPDSKWIGYTMRLRNALSAVYLYSLSDAKATQVTDGMSDARFPVFDKDGKYLFFTASTDVGESLEFDLHAATRQVTRSIYLVVLSKDDPSPFAPESDEEKVTEEKKPEGEKPTTGAVPEKKEAAPASAAKPATEKAAQAKPEPPKPDQAKPAAPETAKPAAPKTPDVKIDFPNILQRVLAIPMPARRYTGLQVGKAGVLLALESPVAGPDVQGAILHRYDLKARRADVPLSGLSYFEMSFGGDKALSRQGTRWIIAALRPMAPAGAGGGGAAPSAPPAASGGGALATDAIEVRTDPLAEWKQMFRDVWRIEREFFYDPNYHGLDLAAASKRYAPYLDGLSARVDLNYLFREMLGEISVGHMYIQGGEFPEVKRVPTGLLGADYSIENGRYRFARVFNGENWTPQLRAPLTQPGVNVVAGEYLLEVNGRNATSAENVYSYFEALSGKSVRLRVGPNPTTDGSREVIVVPVASESGLRNLAWIEGNRRLVDARSGGKIAYVYMPDTSTGGLTAFKRYFFAQVGKDAVIIDERFNGGGSLATDIVEYLQRKLMTGVAPRDGDDTWQPQGAIFGPKAMIINEFAGSGGDAMPWLFKRAGLGPLIGKRTWGGLVGIGGYPTLMDGGAVTAPSIGVWNAQTSQWEIENNGIAPDIEVELDPEVVRQGKDPQLDKAIEAVMAALAKNPVVTPKRPAFPNFHKK